MQLTRLLLSLGKAIILINNLCTCLAVGQNKNDPVQHGAPSHFCLDKKSRLCKKFNEKKQSQNQPHWPSIA